MARSGGSRAMPNEWARWDAAVKATGRPTRAAQELNDLEILILLSDEDPHRDVEKRILREEAYRRMGHEERAAAQPRTAEPTRRSPPPGELSQLPKPGEVVDPF